MQDDQIGPKIVGLAPADTAKLHPSIITKNSNKQPMYVVCQLCQHLLCTCLALQGTSSVFISTLSI
jgi:Rieske Fe-S protein